MTNDQQAIARITELAMRGQLDAAERACRELLAQAPQEHRAWAWLGMLALAKSQPAQAEQALRQAVGLYPHDARYWHPLSAALRMLGKPADAETAARSALELSDTGEHWASLANCLFDQRRWPDAAAAYRHAIARQTDDTQTWTNLGVCEQALGRLDAAQQAYERALALAPDDLNASMRYALLMVQRGDVRRGIELCESLLKRTPGIAAAWLLLGNAQRLADDLGRSESAFREALRLAPANTEARFNLALVLLQQMRACEAEHWARELVAENPRNADAWTVLGGALQMQARAEEGIAAMRRALELNPNPTNHSKLLAALHYAEVTGPLELRDEHQRWDIAYARPLLPATPMLARKGLGQLPLRIALVGNDFCASPTGYLALRGLEHLDKSKCSLLFYSDRLIDDEHTSRFRALADAWRPTMSLTDEQLAAQIRLDEVDVLIDLGGHVGRRLLAFARRPAPLQITWLGYVGTTGCLAMDGLLADRFHERPGEEAAYIETVLRMPGSYICYEAPRDAPQVAALPALAGRHITFGCLNNPSKFSPQTLHAWAEILRRVPTARLFLKYGGLEQQNFQNRIRGEFAARGVSPERIGMEGRSSNLEMMAAYGQVDVALDTQPYSGGLTTCEALWMGVPVITVPGKTFASRHSTSHMTNAGFPQFIAADWQGYIDLAVDWATRLDELAILRSQMRDQIRQSPLCDGPRFAADFLNILQQAWQSRLAAGSAWPVVN
jgi:protein O-GlcNAc transferase